MTLAESLPFPDPDGGCPVLVVAHPDDEALWFSSVLSRVRRIVICFRAHRDFPDLAAARRRSLAEHPLRDRIVDLGLDESRSFNRADWSNPVESDSGLVLGDPDAAGAYADRAAAIERALPSLLEDATAVFTHNPWGEYGHEDHVQVSRVVTRAAIARRLPIWYSTYAGTRSLPLLRRYLDRGPADYVLVPSDPELGAEIADVYRRHGAWTWFDDCRWFRHDCFVQGPLDQPSGATVAWLAPINLLHASANPTPPRGTPDTLGGRVRRRWNRLTGKDDGRND